MTSQATHIEAGSYCNVEIDGLGVHKTTFTSFTYQEAITRLDLLRAYSADLDREPIPVAPLTSTSLVETIPGAFAVRFTMGLALGQSVESLLPEERFIPVAGIIGHLCAMSKIKSSEGPDVLEVPVDAFIRNWYVANGTTVLVDTYPPLSRDKEGHIQICRGLNGSEAAELNTGRLGTMVPKIIAEAIPYHLGKKDTIDWAMGVLPRRGDRTLRKFLTQKTTEFVDKLFVYKH